MILAIDPGTTESGWCVIDHHRKPQAFGKTPNNDLLVRIATGHFAGCRVVIEMVASYGMPVGREVFETCVWIGRFLQESRGGADLIYRKDVKLHHCNHPRATDATIRQALVDRFAPGQRNHGKGTKATPGWFYGFRADIWQAYALAVYAADMLEELP